MLFYFISENLDPDLSLIHQWQNNMLLHMEKHSIFFKC